MNGSCGALVRRLQSSFTVLSTLLVAAGCAPRPAAPSRLRIGIVDTDRVFQGYDKSQDRGRKISSQADDIIEGAGVGGATLKRQLLAGHQREEALGLLGRKADRIVNHQPAQQEGGAPGRRPSGTGATKRPRIGPRTRDRVHLPHTH